MAIKKSELYSHLWRSCDELRGGMDASQYKDYILTLLFVKYVSDKYAGQPDALLEVPEGGSFADMVALKGDKDIGEGINVIIARLAEANELKGVIDLADFNDPDKLGKGQEMVDRLTNLVGIFEESGLDFSKNRAEDDDILGDAYEYLMRNFAEQSGKSKGQFYTPAEVSRIMAKVIGVGQATSSAQTIYDPTCGSGSLLIKAHDEAPSGLDLTIYGQEMDNATAALARMNMILHDCPAAAHDIWQGNTLADPHFKNPDGSLKTFDFAVANPPFSTKSWSQGFDPYNDRYERFVDGVPPKKNGDYAFLLHLIRSLKSTGKGAIILPHGVLFRGNSEAVIRRNILRRGYIKGIIGLPANLFYGTGIPACIIVLDKESAAGRTGIFMIDASKGFVKDGNKNRLRHQDIHRIVDVFNNQREVPRYSRMVPMAEIEGNDFNLNIPRYIDATEPEDLQDIEAHLLGGIPNRDVEVLSEYWQVFPSLKDQLFMPGDRAGYSQMRVDAAEVKPTICARPEFAAYTQAVATLFDRWKDAHVATLKGISTDTKPKQLIEVLSEDMLSTFRDVKLIDSYDVYQHLMSYWSDVMQDDVYMIASDGWAEASRLRLVVEDKKVKEKPDLVLGKRKYKADLIPPSLLIARYYAEEQQAIDALEAEIARLAQEVEEMRDEHGGEEGLLSEVMAENGKVTKGDVKSRLREIKGDSDFADEREVLEKYLALVEKESETTKKMKDARKALDVKLAARYGELTDEEVIVLVVDDKWLASLAAHVRSELDRVSQSLTGRTRELAERYAIPLPKLGEEVEDLSTRVDEHLKDMGFAWK
ncbi:MAG: type I restriction-modification system subunit M [Armatimonadetes bacterium]|nr:type I restriction-modification system subunit M [Armatimonadota bacterium]